MFIQKAEVVFYLFILTGISFLNGMENDIVSLLNEVVDNDAEPTNVFIKSCWSLSKNIEFLKKSAVQVVFISDFLYKLPIDLSPNNVMFVVNLDCEWASDFVNGVGNVYFLFYLCFC